LLRDGVVVDGRNHVASTSACSSFNFSCASSIQPMQVRDRELAQAPQRQHPAQIAELLDRLAAARQHRERRADFARAERDRARELRVRQQIRDHVRADDAPLHFLAIHLVRDSDCSTAIHNELSKRARFSRPSSIAAATSMMRGGHVGALDAAAQPEKTGTPRRGSSCRRACH
jgi:hypothetical protein